MPDHFFTTKFCDRCHSSLDGKSRQMSRFNTDCLCPACTAEEQAHPDYRKAADAEMNAVLHGDHNFPGIGWPGKDGRVK